MGQQAADTTFALHTPQGKTVPVQTWTTATWPVCEVGPSEG